jgi:cobalt-zinc-cadmium resistance protein CzcA
VRYYRSSALREAEELMKAADLMFRESETDIVEYIQSLNAVKEIRRGYIEAVYQYNIAALEYELYR